MILTADYHTHTPYSHGKNTVAENVCAAKEKGLQGVAVSDHGFAHLAFGVARKKIPACRAECQAAEKEYGVKVLLGMEANILGASGKTDLRAKDYDDFDIFLCGNHIFVAYESFGEWWRYGMGNILSRKFRSRPSDKLIAHNTKAYIQTLKNNPVDILTHLNYLCPADALEVAKCAADYGTYIELNSKKEHLTDEELNEIVQKTSVRFVVDSDAHSASRVGDTARVETQLARLNFPMDRIDNIDGRTPTLRFKDYKSR